MFTKRADSHIAQAAKRTSRGEMKSAEAYTNMPWVRKLPERNGPGDTIAP